MRRPAYIPTCRENQSRETLGMRSIVAFGIFFGVTALVLAFLLVLERMIS
jgi:hypothetical protein